MEENSLVQAPAWNLVIALGDSLRFNDLDVYALGLKIFFDFN